MLLYNVSFARYNSSSLYVPPNECTVLGLVTYDCALSEGDTVAGLYPTLAGDPLKDNVTDADKTYSVGRAKSEVMEFFRTSSCGYDVSRMANNDNDVSASFASTTVALSLCLATLLFLM